MLAHTMNAPIFLPLNQADMKNPIAQVFLLFSFLCLLTASFAQNQIQNLDWKPIPLPALPKSIKIYETNTPFPDSTPLHAVYAMVDLADSTLELALDHVHPDGPRLTPQEFIDRQQESVYLAINGSFFRWNGSSVSLIIQNGTLVATGQTGVTRKCTLTNRDTTYYPTWAAWGLMPDGTQEIGWTWTTKKQPTIIYHAPFPNDLNQMPLPKPTLAGYQDHQINITGKIWKPELALGGTPALVIDGQIQVAQEELINCPGLCGKHPRTAIGFTADNKFILLVVDGRQPNGSVGATLPELAQIMRSLGCINGINIDGGGSSVFIANQNQVLSRPSDKTGMRPVGNVLLVKRQNN